MNVLFLTLVQSNTLKERNTYTDLLREFVKNGHEVYVISPSEKREGKETHVITEPQAIILQLQIGNIQKTNIVEKGISTLLIGPQIKAGIKKYYNKVKFDLVLYSTPPITVVGAIEYVKRRDGARTYLLLKDIFPQNAVDIGMMSKTGVKGILYKHFRKQEKKLYRVSDTIGYMSQANVDYVLAHNPEVKKRDDESRRSGGYHIIEACPNSIDVIDKSVDEETRRLIRAKYGIPPDRIVFIYGGNLGKPQGIPFLIRCLKQCANVEDVFFLIVGDGTEYHLLQTYVETEKPENLKLMKRLPKDDYDTMVGACDVGLLFLDHRFTIPNFPSRLLSYMQAKLPVLAATDVNSDIGKVITAGGFGWWCESNDENEFIELIRAIKNTKLSVYGEAGYRYLIDNYSSNYAYSIVNNSEESQ